MSSQVARRDLSHAEPTGAEPAGGVTFQLCHGGSSRSAEPDLLHAEGVHAALRRCATPGQYSPMSQPAPRVERAPRSWLTATAVLIVVAGCTSTERSRDADDGSVESELTTAVLTTPPARPASTIAVTSSPPSRSSTAASTTTVTFPSRPSSTAPSPTTQPAPTTTDASGGRDGLVLRADGIGPLAFGTSDADALAVLEAALGGVVSDWLSTFAVDRGDGTFIDESSAQVFVHPAQRTTCFDNALCVVFGGADAGSLTLVGWVQNDQSVGPPLATLDGVTVGSTWADHVDDLDVAESGCYSIGYGSTSGGIRVELISAGDPFLAYDEAGNEIPTEPDPADVTVLELSAGPRPGNPEEGEC
jgi:hypothetical protein